MDRFLRKIVDDGFAEIGRDRVQGMAALQARASTNLEIEDFVGLNEIIQPQRCAGYDPAVR